MSFLINPFAFAVAGGDYEAISSVTVGSGGASSIEFTSIPSGFQHLQVRLVARTERADTQDAVKLQVNSDTASNYAFHLLYGTGASASADAQTSATGISLYRVTGDTASASIFGAIVFDILDYASTTKNKTVRSLGGADRNGAGEMHITSGLWMSTSAITSLKLTGAATGADLAQYSTAALYGIKA